MKKRNLGILVAFAVLLLLAITAGSAEAILVSVKLAWCPVNDPAVLGYNLYHGTASRVYDAPVDVGNVILVDLEDFGIEFNEGVNQYFAVTAYDSGGSESAFSAELVVNVVEGNGTHDNWVKVRGSDPIDGFDNTYPVIFFTSSTATSASQNKTNLTMLDLQNYMLSFKVLAAGTGSYLPYITVILSALLPDNTSVNVTLLYKYIDPSLNSHTSNTATFGLGQTLNDGQWHTFNRDLVADLISANFNPSVTITGFISANVYSYKNTARAPSYEDFRLENLIFASNVGTSSCP